MINAEAPLGLVVAPQVLLAGVTRLLHLRVVSVVPGPPFMPANFRSAQRLSV